MLAAFILGAFVGAGSVFAVRLLVFARDCGTVQLAARESARTQDAELSDWEARRVETSRIVGGRIG